jgi:hypothetical protein
VVLSKGKLLEVLQLLSSLERYLEILLDMQGLPEMLSELERQAANNELRVFDTGTVAKALDLDKKSLTALVSGAIKMSIHAHGPITADNIGSVTKRIVGYLLARSR